MQNNNGRSSTTNYCDELCEKRSYDAFFSEAADVHQGRIAMKTAVDEGWLHMANHAGLVKQCESCAAKDAAPSEEPSPG